jgi:hypothetical protein
LVLTYDISNLQDAPEMQLVTSARSMFHDYSSVDKDHAIFLRLGDCGYDYDLHYIDYEYLDHAYYIIDYLDIDISVTPTTLYRKPQSTLSALALVFMILLVLLREGRKRHMKGIKRRHSHSPRCQPKIITDTFDDDEAEKMKNSNHGSLKSLSLI